MLVPRSFTYAASSSNTIFDEKRESRKSRKSMSARSDKKGLRPASPARTISEPARSPTPPIPVRTPHRTSSTQSQTLSTATCSPHDPNALPPAVAALLAVTQIPRGRLPKQRSHKTQRGSPDSHADDGKSSLTSSYGRSPALSILLEDDDMREELHSPANSSVMDDDFLRKRTISSESVPSLDADNISIVSNNSPSTPESIRSRKSMTNLRRQSTKSALKIEECETSHPLIPGLADDEGPDDEFILSPPSAIKTGSPKPKSGFKSNLTTSLQALKSATIASISSFSFSGSSPASTVVRQGSYFHASQLSDDVLWSHPFLFPRFSPEIRPAIEGIPTEAQRRYLNPIPLTFEEQEAPYQQALHAPYLAEQIESAPTIQMQAYGRAKRKVGSKRGPHPDSELGRALFGVRQRELRENSDFLRVVVFDMEMKRKGKLEYGKARLWLPPRKVNPYVGPVEKVPSRWVGESAY